MFWELERFSAASQGIFDSGEQQFVSYSKLLERVTALQKALPSRSKVLVALQCDNSIASLIAYLAALRAGHTIVLINATTASPLRRRLFEIYRPEIIIGVGENAEVEIGYQRQSTASQGLTVTVAESPCNAPLFADTAVLLSTSGTTGSPKLIRLSYRNLQANAESIVQYLGIGPSETAITSLPMSYSYGLSVINSHLEAGANLVCTNASIVAREFWDLFAMRQCTSFAGVPFTYGMLERLKFAGMNLPSLRMMTQAGGRLAPEKIETFADLCRQKGLKFFVMYGQTEATARISYVPWERLTEKVGSVGQAIPGGKLRIERDGTELDEAGAEGELVYEGANVMLGYATSRDCLAKGDEMGGCLRTGDLGYRDADGFFFITGRLKRFIKVFGLRLNLDEVEKMLESKLSCPVACLGRDEALHVVAEADDETKLSEAKRHVVELYKLHHSVVQTHRVPQLPVNGSGKKDYSALSNVFE